MKNYVLKRILWAIPTLLGITIVTFSVMHVAPGEPSVSGQEAGFGSPTQAEYVRAAEHYGWDRPLLVQYGTWLSSAVRLDFGRSFADGQPVLRKISRALPATLLAGLAALALSLLLSVPTGLFCARYRNSWFDSLSGVTLYSLYAVPAYALAILLILLLGVRFDALPFRGMTSDGFADLSAGRKMMDVLLHLVLITFCLAARPFSFQSRFIRGNLLEISETEYFRTARAKGLAPHSLWTRHALRNSLIPLITLVALSVPALLSGAVILEVIFSWPGIGRLFFESVMQRDYPTVMGLSVFSAVLVLGATLIADIAYAWVDPRVTYD